MIYAPLSAGCRHVFCGYRIRNGTIVAFNFAQESERLENVLRQAFPNSAIVTDEGWHGRVHAKIVSPIFNDKSEREKQDLGVGCFALRYGRRFSNSGSGTMEPTNFEPSARRVWVRTLCSCRGGIDGEATTQNGMKIRVLLFGHYRESAPLPLSAEGVFDLVVPEGATVTDLAATLAAMDKCLSDLLTRTRVAVGTEFVSPDTVLSSGDEIAFLPPMSGG